ncbi:MAG: DUF6077 domain-containing protein [Gemmatales bacterium]|nr:DUF6077 domain-containing protein [Gemmatales bacterium]MDW8387797.1 DUF6077 domain-containing protein [Gemmatales bacterium]
MSPTEQLLYGDGFGIGTLRFAAVLLLFWLPGFLWSRWLHRGNDLSWPLQLTLGWISSLAVFGVVAWPFLWFRLRFADFLATLSIIWTLWTALALFLLFYCKRSANSGRVISHATTRTDEAFAAPPDLKTSDTPFAFALFCIFLAEILIWIPQLTRNAIHRWTLLHWLFLDVLTVAFILALWAKVRSYQRTWSSWLRFGEDDDRPARPIYWMVALGFIGLQIASAAVLDRPDWDDCYYLAAVLDFTQAERLNLAEPTHREGLPLNVINVLIAWELWQAVLCWASGLNPMVVAHGLLPPLLIALAYSAYHGVLSEILPRRWVPLALLGVAAYHVWGISSHDTSANYLLTRIWQGKAALLHIGLPMLVWSLHHLAKQLTDPRRWLSLLAGVLAALVMSSSAIFLVTLLIPVLAAAVWLTSSQARRWLIVLAGLVSVIPSVAMGLLLRTEVVSDPSLNVDAGSWTWWRGFDYWHHYTGFGSSEKVWLVFLPLLSLLLFEKQRRGYLVYFPILAWLTFANPFLADFVATYLTSYHTYFRVYWLLPVACGLGATLALLSRVLARSLPDMFPNWTLWQQASVQTILPLGIALVGLIGTMLTPTLYVWSGDNLRLLIPDAETHRLAENPAKMPQDLIDIADQMLRDEAISEVNILATEEVVNYLTPLSRDFRFVHTRVMYTLQMYDRAGRREEGQKRYLLSLLLVGELPQPEGQAPKQFVNLVYPLPRFPDPPVTLGRKVLATWLDELRCRYAIIPHFLEAKTGRSLEAVGFRQVWRGQRFSLWIRELPDSAAKGDSSAPGKKLR